MLINKIYTEDCLSTMSSFPDRYIDMVLTSPPYDNLREYKGYTFNFKQTANELFRILKDGGVIIWVVGDQTKNGSESGTSFMQALYFKELGLNIHDTMIYRKLNYTPLTHNRYEQEWEYMFCFSKGKPKTFNPIKIPCKYAGQETWGSPKLYKDASGNLTEIEKYKIGEEKIKGNIFEYRTGSTTQTGRIKHPAMFPEQLALDQVRSWSQEGNLVYDPFMGSGTTAIACIKQNRNFVGSEISPEYVEIANERIKNTKNENPD